MRNRVLLILFLIFTNLSFGQSTEQQFFDQAAISYYKKDYKKAADQVQSGLDKFPNSTILSELKEKIHAKISVVQNPKPVNDDNGGGSGGSSTVVNEKSEKTTNGTSDVISQQVKQKNIRASLTSPSQNKVQWSKDLSENATSIIIVFDNGYNSPRKYDVTGQTSFLFNEGDNNYDKVKVKVSLEVELPEHVKLIDKPNIQIKTICSLPYAE